MSFWGELKRRNVYKVGVAYLIVAWLIAQLVSIIQEPLGLPDWFEAGVLVLLAIGFPLALVFAWAFELTPEGIKKTRQVPLEESITHLTGSKLNYVVTGLLAVAVVFLVLDNYVLTDGSGTTASTAPASEGPTDADAQGRVYAIAVLPFANLSSDEEQQYFADGLSEELLNGLAQISALRVTARTSSFAFKDTNRTAAEIAATLGVEYLLEGSVRKSGDTVRITAQLIEARGSSHLWSATYDRMIEDVFAIQEEIALTVADRLSETLGIVDVELFPGGTEDVMAFDRYLAAQALLNGAIDRATFFAAIDEYEQALALDPNFALAQVGLAEALFQALNIWVGQSGMEDVPRRASEAMARALESGPDLPGTFRLVAEQRIREQQWRGAHIAMQEMLARSSQSDVTANLAFGTFLVTAGRAAEALPYLERARRLDPLDVDPPAALAIANDALGNHERAVELFGGMRNLVGYGALSFMPQFWRVLATGDVEAARRVLETEGATLNYGPIFQSLDDREATLATLRALYAQEGARDTTFITGNVGLMAAHLGDVELSLAAWRDALRSPGFMLFTWTPLMAPLRAHPGFKDLVRDLNLDDYWREYGWPTHCRPVGAADFECS